MNNRFKEIAVEAGLIFAENDTMGRKELRYEEKRFAELILADIDKIVDVMYKTYAIEQAVTLIDLDFIIKEHFYGLQNEN
jgi:hypothetical protein